MVLEFEVGDRVAGMDSFYVGTVIYAYADGWCVVEWDTHGRYLWEKRKETIPPRYIYHAAPYQEFHNACGMLKDGVATVIPKPPSSYLRKRVK